MEKPDVKNIWVHTLPICINKARTTRINPIFELDDPTFCSSSRFFQIRYPLIKAIRKPWE
jgi:hypothetical protein